jgi:hypothetical protein
MKITLEPGPYWTFLLRAETGITRLVQHDADFPGVARTFGWRANGNLPAAIWDAYDFIEQRLGDTVDDSGYF